MSAIPLHLLIANQHSSPDSLIIRYVISHKHASIRVAHVVLYSRKHWTLPDAYIAGVHLIGAPAPTSQPASVIAYAAPKSEAGRRVGAELDSCSKVSSPATVAIRNQQRPSLASQHNLKNPPYSPVGKNSDKNMLGRTILSQNPPFGARLCDRWC